MRGKGPDEVAFALRVEDLAGFRTEHGRWPRTGTGVPGDEARIGGWLSRQRQALVAGHLAEGRRRALDERTPGWADGAAAQVSWDVSLELVAAFREARGHLPRSGRSVASDEDRLGRWVQRQRQRSRRGVLAPALRKTLDERLPGWGSDRVARQVTSVQHRRFVDTVNEVATFRAGHGTWPSHRASDPAERRLGSFLNDQRNHAHGGSRAYLLTPQRRAVLDELVPGWQDRSRRNEPWQQKARRVAEFRAAHGRWPKQRAADPTERSLGQWFASQRAMTNPRHRNADEMTPDRRAHLDAVIPGWDARKPKGPSWDDRFEALVRWRTVHGADPVGETGTDERAQLALWLHRQRYSAKKGRLGAERIARLDRELPGWRGA